MLRVVSIAFCLVLASCSTPQSGTAQPAPQPTIAAASASKRPAPTAAPDPVAPGIEDLAFVNDAAFFTPKRPAKPAEWLDRFPQTGITFDEYVARRPVSTDGQRRVIVIQPLGKFSKDERNLLGTLREYMASFFAIPAVVAPEKPLPKRGIRTRSDGGKTWQQMHTMVLLNEVLAPNLPANAVCYLGVTMTDLYPEPSWNYVFGQATLDQRVGVYSLARYMPSFWGESVTPRSRSLAVLRAFKVMSHETGHMFSMEHCTRFECNMNGSNSLEEMDGQPVHLCPVCLKMLQWNLHFDVRERYGKLRDIYRREGLEEQASWVDRRLKAIGAGGGGQSED